MVNFGRRVPTICRGSEKSVNVDFKLLLVCEMKQRFVFKLDVKLYLYGNSMTDDFIRKLLFWLVNINMKRKECYSASHKQLELAL